MKATINGIDVEGTKEEVVELIRLFGTQQQMQPLPQLPSPYTAPVMPYTTPYIGTPLPGISPPWKFGEVWCGSGFVEAKHDPNVVVMN